MKLNHEEKCDLAMKIVKAVLLSLVIEGGGRFPEGPFLQDDKNIELSVEITSAVYKAETGAHLCVLLEKVLEKYLPYRRCSEAMSAAINAIGDIP